MDDPVRCPLTYDLLNKSESYYSGAGLRRLSRRLGSLEPLPFTAPELRQEAAARANRMSVGGVQPKLSATLSPSRGRFEIVDRGGRYILKPPTEAYPDLPENEDLTMRLAAAAGVVVPPHGLLYAKDGSLCYFIERFDRMARGGSIHVEDFAQLLGASRETKYDSSMEKVASVVATFATFPTVEKRELFLRTLVAFLVGAEDMHLKNFSLLHAPDGVIRLTPAYDFVNSSILLRDPDELALPIGGKRRRLKREDLIEYWGRERLGLTDRVIDVVITRVTEALPTWRDLIGRSFLSPQNQEKYLALVEERLGRLGFE
jgi:serine/threonine-protein kinase HipA